MLSSITGILLFTEDSLPASKPLIKLIRWRELGRFQSQALFVIYCGVIQLIKIVIHGISIKIGLVHTFIVEFRPKGF